MWDKDGHISDELLAAFLDGSTTHAENEFIFNSIERNPDIVDVFSIASEAIDMNSINPVFDPEFFDNLQVDEFSEDQGENIYHFSDRLDDLAHSIQENNSNHQLNYKEMDISSSNRVVGENPIEQKYSDTCAIKSQQLILQDFGVYVTEDSLVEWSHEQGLYDGNGTNPAHVGILLDVAGIPVTHTENATVFDLANALAQGQRVIVGVDSTELWASDQSGAWTRFKEWWKDFWGNETPDHALIVTSIDNRDPNNPQVLLTDPGNGEHKYYKLDDFMNAWQDSGYYMISTDITPAEFAAIQIENNQPAIHLAEIAGVNYNDFQLFHDMSQALPPMNMWDYTENLFHPVQSLMDAYMQYAQDMITFSNFNQFSFNQYLDPALFTTNFAETLQFNLNQLYQNNPNELNHMMDFMRDFGVGHFDLMNDPYGDMFNFFNDQMIHFNETGNTDLYDFCQQQVHYLDMCQNIEIDPVGVYHNTFLSFLY